MVKELLEVLVVTDHLRGFFDLTIEVDDKILQDLVRVEVVCEPRHQVSELVLQLSLANFEGRARHDSSEDAERLPDDCLHLLGFKQNLFQ